jgi:hypothetical protein
MCISYCCTLCGDRETAAVQEMIVRIYDLVPIAGFTGCATRAVNHIVRTYDLVPIAGFTGCATRAVNHVSQQGCTPRRDVEIL